MQHVNPLPAIFDDSDQPVIVAFDIEYRAIAYRISVPKGVSRISEITPTHFTSDFIPVQQ
jgi:hypothetical protein